GCVIWTAAFFFQAEDGIRYRNVTGVQTCALPISSSLPKAVIKLFHNVLRRIVNPTLNNLNSCFSLCGKTSNGSRGVKETIAESTFGLGIKAVLETVNANVASTRYCTAKVRAP